MATLLPILTHCVSVLGARVADIPPPSSTAGRPLSPGGYHHLQVVTLRDGTPPGGCRPSERGATSGDARVWAAGTKPCGATEVSGATASTRDGLKGITSLFRSLTPNNI